MDWFKDQFAQSNIISGVLALLVWCAVIYLAVTGAAIPDVLIAGGMAIIAFFFGSKVGQREGMNEVARQIERFVSGGKDGKL